MPAAFKVVIVEDDLVISRVYAALVESIPCLSVAATARTATAGLAAIESSQPQLVLLDYGLPGGVSGPDLLRRLRADGHRLEVISITSHASTELVRESMRLGVMDYLVKPFPEERLRQALRKFVQVSSSIPSPTLPQEDVDRLRESRTPAKEWIPRELSAQRLREVREILLSADGAAITADELALRLGSSRVTARRYLEFLLARHEVLVDTDTDKPGRPRKLYTLTSPRQDGPRR